MVTDIDVKAETVATAELDTAATDITIVTATDFRKDMFRMLDAALRGHPLEVVYKGEKVRILPKTLTEMTRLEQLASAPPLLTGNYDNLLDDMKAMSSEMEAAWDKKWEGHPA